jgi:hypothetical protein
MFSVKAGPVAEELEMVYTVAFDDTWSETQSGLDVEKATPHGFNKFESVSVATPEVLAIRLVCAYWARARLVAKQTVANRAVVNRANFQCCCREIISFLQFLSQSFV